MEVAAVNVGAGGVEGVGEALAWSKDAVVPEGAFRGRIARVTAAGHRMATAAGVLPDEDIMASMVVMQVSEDREGSQKYKSPVDMVVESWAASGWAPLPAWKGGMAKARLATANRGERIGAERGRRLGRPSPLRCAYRSRRNFRARAPLPRRAKAPAAITM